jgi:hypothetical protein
VLKHVLGRLGQSADGRERSARDDEAEPGCDHHAARGNEEEEEADAAQRLVHLVEGTSDLHGHVGTVRKGEHPDVTPVDGDVSPEGGTLAAGDRQDSVVHGKLDILAWRDDRGTVVVHDLRVAAHLAELRPQREERLSLRGLEETDGMAHDLRGPLLERLVDRSAQLLACDYVHEHGGSHDRERDSRRGRHGDAGAEAHPSRSA